MGKTIRFGLSAVKNVGTGAVGSIIAARKAKGPFKSLYDFCERVDLRLCNRKVLESLIKCGAFDDLKLKRAQLFSVLDRFLEIGSRTQRDRLRGQLSLMDQFGDSSEALTQDLKIPELEEWPESQLLGYERELLGFYVSAHPLAKHEQLLVTYATTTTSNLSELKDQEELTIGGIVNTIREIVTKRGDRMAFVGLEDLDGRCEVIVFPDLFKSSASLLQKDSILFIRGKVNAREDTPKVIAEELIPIEDVEKKLTKVVSIDLLTAGLELETLKRLKEILMSHPGKTPVYIHFRDPGGRKTVLHSGEELKVETGQPLFEQLEQLLGANVIKIRS